MKLIISPRADYDHNACPRAVIMAVPKFWFRNCHRMGFFALIASLKHSVKNFDSIMLRQPSGSRRRSLGGHYGHDPSTSHVIMSHNHSLIIRCELYA